MNRIKTLVFVLGLAFGAGSAHADGRNGSGLILRDEQALIVWSNACETLVVVVSASQIRTAAAKIRGSVAPLDVKVNSNGAIVQVRPVGNGMLVGRERGSGRQVLVVTPERAYELGLDAR